MSQIHASSKVKQGFFVFVLGCVIAISGAAKLHSNDKMMRTRGLLEDKAKKVVVAALVRELQKTRLRLTVASMQELSKSRLAALFLSEYQSLLKAGASHLGVRSSVVWEGHLEPELTRVMIGLWKEKVTPPAAKWKGGSLALNVLSRVLHSKKKANKKQANASRQLRIQEPKAVGKVAVILRDKSVERLVPYALWNLLLGESRRTVSAMARDSALTSVAALFKVGVAQQTTKGAMNSIAKIVGLVARRVGKQLHLRSKDYALKLSSKSHLAWAASLAPKLSAKQALERAQTIASKVVVIITEQYATHLTEHVAKKIRLEYLAVAFRQAVRAPVVRRKVKVVRQPTSQPRAALRRASPPPRRRAASSRKESLGLLVLGGKKERIGGWPDTLPIFLFGLGVALFGLFVWKRGVALEAAAKREGQAEDASNPFVLLAEIQSPLRSLQDDIEDLQPEEVCDRVDALLSRYVLPFAEVRRGVLDQLGMEKGAEVLVVVAYGERMLNRVWTAASDGHLPEARSVLPDAITAFQEASGLANGTEAPAHMSEA